MIYDYEIAMQITVSFIIAQAIFWPNLILWSFVVWPWIKKRKIDKLTGRR